MTFDSGYLVLGSPRGAAARLHWTIPLGALCASGFEARPVAWLAYLALLSLHVVGHAFFARRARLSARQLDVHALGGAVRWAGDANAPTQLLVAWGGVLAQLTGLLLVALPAAIVGVPADAPWLADVVHVYVSVNAVTILLNLLPLRPCDGGLGWRIVHYLRTRRRVGSGELVRVHRVRVVEHHVPLTSRQRQRLAAEIDAQIASVAELHHQRAIAASSSEPDRPPAE